MFASRTDIVGYAQLDGALQCGNTSGGADRVEGMGVAVNKKARPSFDRVADLAAHEHAGQRAVARRQSFPEGHQVGDDVVVIRSEEGSGSPCASHHFIGDQQHLMGLAGIGNTPEVADRWCDRAARCTDDRLDDHGGDLAGLALEGRLNLIGTGQPAGGWLKRQWATETGRLGSGGS